LQELRKGENVAFSGILEEMTIDDVRALNVNVCVFPIGSTEPHGPALPYGTDSFQVQATSYGGTRRANDLGGRVLCFPTQRVSLNNNFRVFPFACRMQVPTFMSLLKDLVEMCEAEGVRRFVFVNGHGGNPDVIRAVQRDLAGRDGLFTCLISTASCASEEAAAVWEHRSDHAGEEETSLIMHLEPDLVRKEHITDNPQNLPKVSAINDFKVDFVRPWHLYIPASAGGNATRASAEKGQIVVDSAIVGMGRLFYELSLAPDTDTFPY
jgi:creatinine amidohydrolase